MQLKDYEVKDLLHRGEVASVYRGTRTANHRPVILKMLREDAEHRDRLRLLYEYEQLQRVAGPHTPRPIELLKEGGALGLVTEDIGALALSRLPRLGEAEVLHVAIAVADALITVHRGGVVHKDISPNNIIFNRDSGAVQLIDFSISSRIEREAQPLGNLRGIEGTLQYISPEQTGRMNRLLDYRSDFYSLGATLFWALSGSPPFLDMDIAKLVHAILAKPAPPLAHASPMLAAVIARLLEKVPEDRYQSGQGLLHDLKRCAEGATFPLGEADVSERFRIPQRLYGREADITRLLECYAQVAEGRRAIVTIAGPSGIGKSALVNEVQRAIVEHDGWFAAGKMDQLRRHIPFSALGDALGSVVQRILQEPEAELEQWRQRVRNAVGGLGQVLIDQVPLAAALLGPQKAVPTYGAQETENRLLLVLQRFITVLASSQPLVLFIDDLQWSDAGTLKLIKNLALDVQATAGLLLALAYRDNEVHPGHAVHRLLAELPQIIALTVAPMTDADVTLMVADTTGRSLDDARALAQIINGKVHGNPFMAREYFEYLHRQKLVYFDNGWTWDVDAVAAAAVSDNVAQLLNQHLRTLPPESHQLLSYAACLGNQFNLSDLIDATARKREAVLQQMRPVLQAGLLLPVHAEHRYAEQSDDDVRYRFAHDRIQQAAFELLPAPEMMRTRRTIGLRLLERSPDAVLNVVDHLNAAASLIEEPAERARLVQLNHTAAGIAQKAAAFPTAIEYLRAARAMQPSDAWEVDPSLTRQILADLIECEYLAGDMTEVRQHLEEIKSHPGTVIEEATMLGKQVQYLTAATQFSAALQPGIDALRLLGFPIKEKPTRLDAALKMTRILWSIWGRSVDSLVDAPAIHNEKAILASRILVLMIMPSYFVNPLLWLEVALASAQLGLRYGGSVASARGLSIAALAATRFNRYREARKLSRAARRLADKPSDTPSVGGVAYLVTSFVDALRLPPRAMHEELHASFEKMLEEGDPTNAAGAALADWRIALLLSVDECTAVLDASRTYMSTRRDAQVRGWFNTVQQACRCLAGQTRSATSFADDDFDENAEEAMYLAGKAGGAAGTYFATKAFVLFMHRDAKGTVAAARRSLAAGFGQTGTGHAMMTFCVVALLAMLQTRDADKALFSQLRRRLRNLSQASSVGYASLYKIVEARRRGDPELCVRAVNDAIALQLPAYTVLVCEEAARLFSEQGDTLRASACLAHVAQGARAWGATLKLKMLQEEFPQWVVARAAKHTASASSSTTDSAHDIELPTLMRAFAALSAERNVNRLVQVVVDALMEIAGATRAALLLPQGGALVVVADSHPGQIPREVTDYVYRTQTPWLRHEPHSVLAAPLMFQGSLKGVAYLVNDLSTHAFSESRLQLVQLLAAQAAVSLDNAHTQNTLEEVIANRTQELREAHAKLVQLERSSTEMQMAGGFAHEMLNALGAASFPLASLQAQEDLDPDVRAFVDLAATSVERGTNITREILAYAELGNQKVGTPSSSLNDVVDRVFEDYAEDFAAHHIKPTIHVTGDVRVPMGEEHAHTLLRHLVSNARDALLESESARSLELTVAADPGGLRVEVHDNGPGIDATAQPRIFQPFYSTKGAHGHGLGLALSRKIARLYGGDLDFNSDSEKGTTFRLRLPRQDRPS